MNLETLENKLHTKYGPVGGSVILFIIEVLQIVIISTAIMEFEYLLSPGLFTPSK